MALRSRVLILAPSGRDAALTSAVLQRAGVMSSACSDIPDLLARLGEGAGAAVITEEALTGQSMTELIAWIETQASWSDFPFILLLEQGLPPDLDGHEREALQRAGNLTLLERPIGTATLLSTVRAALRARRRQYEVHDALGALEASEARFRTLTEAMPQLVWTCQPDGRCDYLSRQWVEYTGVPEEKQLGLGWLHRVIHPDDRDRTAQHWADAVAERVEYDIDYRIRRADGEYRWFKARGTPVRDGQGCATKWFGTCTDITDFIEARETLRRGGEELERIVAERTRTLAEANNRLMAEIAERERTQDALRHSQKLESIGQLTSGVAHDFNNLLTAVLGNLELLERRLKDGQYLRFVRAASRAAERGAKLTQQLLAFSRKQRLAPKRLDLNHLVSEACDMLFRTIGTTVRIETVLTAGLWPALVDPTQMELVLLNLAINGRDAMPDGGRLTIRTANIPRNEAPRELAPGDYVLVSVTDTGTGMSPDVLQRAIDPFFTTKEVGKGSGLGLSMVHGVATQSGGGLEIESRPGHGTTVGVYLPRAAADITAIGAEASSLDSLHHGATILVVDDDSDVRDLAVDSLAALGYRVLAAENGPAALKVLDSTERVDLLVADMAMPGMSGVELIRRARERRPALRALFVTGYVDTTGFSPADGDVVLLKPYRLDRLAECVAEALAHEPAAEPPTSNVVAMTPTTRHR